MPGRIRSLKPDFWTNPVIVTLPAFSRLFFIGSWNFADDYGVLKDDPERLRLQILPSDDVDARAIVDELVRARLLLRRRAPDGTAVLVIRTFVEHQRVDWRATGRWGKPDTFTDQDEHIPVGSPPIPTDPIDPAQSRAIPRIPARKPAVVDCSGLDKENDSRDAAREDRCSTDVERTLDPFDEFWKLYPRKLAKKPAEKAWKRATRSASPEAILVGLAAWNVAWQQRNELEFVPYPATWLNQERWNETPEASTAHPGPDFDEAWKRAEEAAKGLP